MKHLNKFGLSVGTFLLSLATGVALALPAGGSAPPTSAGPDIGVQAADLKVAPESAVLAKIHLANHEEIGLALLALRKSGNVEVQQFADKMQKDHQSADAKAIQVAIEQRLNWAGSECIEVAQQQERAESLINSYRLLKLTGGDFDREYMRQMVDAHQMMVDDLTRELGRTGNGAVRALIGELLPVVQEHLQMAQSLRAKL